MKQIVVAIFACLLAISFAGCKKNKGQTRTELLAKSAWKFDNAGLDMNRDGTVDAPVPPGFLQACDTDNTLTFNADGTGFTDEGATKCNGANPQTVPFSWSFKDNEQTINLSNAVFGGLNGDIKVKTINDNQLELHKDVNIGALVNVIVFLKH
ncbi:MAG TPA: lipocalin family protein [Chitinophagaceae bacterium]|nr:lipocalin family protein [Chitinophagaceae bacterium]